MYDTLIRWREGERPGPKRLHLVLTERCNLHCRSCFMGSTPARFRDREVPDERLHQLVEDAIRMGVAEVYLVGGEVFVRRALALGLMERVKAAGLRGDLTTNGTLLDDTTARRIVQMGWERLQVSLDGPDPATNDTLRPPSGTFDRVIAGVERVRRWKERLGSPLPALSLSTVVSNTNHRCLTRMVELAADLGMQDIAFQSLKDQMSEQAPAMRLDPAQRRELVAECRLAAARATSLGVATNLANFLEEGMVEAMGRLDTLMEEDVHDVSDDFFGAHCFVPWYYLVVHHDGRCSPCWEWTGEGMGDARTQSLEEIWHGEVFERFRADFRARRVPGHCAQCCLGYLDHTRWLREMGLLHAGQPREAWQVADRLLARRPWHAQSLEVKARALYALGRVLDARNWLHSVARDAPAEVALASLHLLDVPEQFGDRVGAGSLVQAFQSRIGPEGYRQRPASALRALTFAGRHDEALELADLAASWGVAALEVARARVEAAYAAGDRTGGRRVLAAAVADRTLAPVRERAQLLFLAHRRRDPQGVRAAAAGLGPQDRRDPYARWIEAAALGKLGQRDAAHEVCLDLLRAGGEALDGFKDAVLDTLSDLAFANGNLSAAAAWAEQALALRPSRGDTRRRLAAIRRRQGRQARARRAPGGRGASAQRTSDPEPQPEPAVAAVSPVAVGAPGAPGVGEP